MKLIIKNIYQKITKKNVILSPVLQHGANQQVINYKAYLRRPFASLRTTISIKTFLFFFLITLPSIAQDCGKNYTAFVFNLDNGQIFFENQADKIIYPASLTKLMTLYLAFEAITEKRLNLQDQLVASSRAVAASKVNKNNTLNLELGDQISVEQAIKGSIVRSYNELVVMLAERISGSEWQFVRDMNLAAKDLGMSFSNFHNASGLQDQGQYTTDEDLAILVMAIRKRFPEYYHFFSLKEFTYQRQKYPSHNNVLLKYKGADGMKTGFTNAAGFNLIASAHRNNRKVI